MARVKGICYGNDAFSSPYNPSIANTIAVFDGSDNAAAYIGPLWGADFTSTTGSSCNVNGGQTPHCRNDVNRMKAMGVELIRLYDWDPRNNHLPFLYACESHDIGVIVSVSNYFLQNLGAMDQNIYNLIKSFSNTAGNNYHPAIVGVVFGNEFDKYGVPECIKFTQRWAEIERQRFPGYRAIKIGHPLAFIKVSSFPCWDVWDKLLPPLAALKDRLFLAPQTYNRADYLFKNAENSGRGYVDQTWERYEVPILFTEIGMNRLEPDHAAIVKAQLSGCVSYSAKNPDKLIGFCFFSYTDKVWAEGTTEGSFGAWRHTQQVVCTINYSAKDFTRPVTAGKIGVLNVDHLEKTSLYASVLESYTSA